VACVKDEVIEWHNQATKERLAQSNIKAVINPTTYFDAPPSVATNLNGWVTRTGTGRDLILTAESRAIIDAARDPRPNPVLIYVPSLLGTNTNQRLHGTAISKYFYQTKGDENYLRNAFISATTTNLPFVPGHELVHVLGVNSHSVLAHNVMHVDTLSTNKVITGTKRLTPEQIETIRENVK
jgi:hypothetical protein